MRGPRPWRRISARPVFEHRLFRLETLTLEAEDGDRRDALLLRPPDWVNMIAVDDRDRVLLVRQWRFGVGAETLEIPGGMVDPGESDGAAARRELLEETGHRAREWRRLGVVEPNPAFQSNRCATWLARGLEHVGDPVGDGSEEIAVEWAPLDRVGELIASGAISHSLVVAAFWFFRAEIPGP